MRRLAPAADAVQQGGTGKGTQMGPFRSTLTRPIGGMAATGVSSWPTMADRDHRDLAGVARPGTRPTSAAR